MEAERKQHLHVVMLPWLAVGHINPFFSLSKSLVSHGAIRVSILSTPVNISRIKARLQGEPIELVEMALPSVDGLPPAAECTADIKPEMAHLLHQAFDKLGGTLENLLRLLSPDFVIHDLLASWAAPVAAPLGIPTLVFSTFSPAVFSYVLSQTKHSHANGADKTAEDLTRPTPDYPSTVISWRLFEARQVVGLFMSSREGPTASEQGYQHSCGILIKSCFEEENKYLQYLRDLTGKPVISVGSLMLPEAGAEVEDESGDNVVKWLDRQRPSSVVYVSFGSESYLSAEQINALALALEDTGMPFLWSLRSSQGIFPGCLLPEGFESRTHGRGLIVGGWQPQRRIVSHSSVGSFVTHAGWNSVMEAFSWGLPLVLIPLRHDQGLNCRQIAWELKAGVEVERGADDGSFRREDVCRAVRLVMSNEEIRSKAEQLRGVVALNSGHQHVYVTQVVDHMRKVLASKEKTKNPVST